MHKIKFIQALAVSRPSSLYLAFKQHFLLYVRLNKLQNQSPYSEKDLLLQVAEGNEQAFRQLFDTYRRKLYTYLLQISQSRETAEDCVHDIFLKLWIGREKLPEIQNLNAYLYRMAHNHAFNGLRKMATE